MQGITDRLFHLAGGLALLFWIVQWAMPAQPQAQNIPEILTVQGVVFLTPKGDTAGVIGVDPKGVSLELRNGKHLAHLTAVEDGVMLGLHYNFGDKVAGQSLTMGSRKEHPVVLLSGGSENRGNTISLFGGRLPNLYCDRSGNFHSWP